ncbi:MAG: CDP-diacylglycerol--glycerol-3-phosphate 3-phosphatidyltransferase [Calditrichales bacterium]|nr:MAG: CDP-diacylglycerol--glycerol-3-phosphate 3-phosphatidyltransferase [Calditrichales bacterium]
MMKLTIPNQLTILRILLTPIFLYYFIRESADSILIGTVIFIVAAATDWYDGYIARKFNIITRWGQFMDPLADKILVSSALVAFACLNYLHWWMVITIVLRDFIITFLRMYALHHGKSIVTSQMAKWKTFLQMSAVLVLLFYLNFAAAEIHHLAIYPPGYSNWVTILYLVVTVLTVFSGLQYLVENRSHVYELGRRTVKIFYR